MVLPKTSLTSPQVLHKWGLVLLHLKHGFSTNPRPLLVRLLFYLALILFPANLAKHFLLPSGYILGLLVDYLTPAVYLTELFVFLLLLVNPWTRPKNFRFLFLLLLFLFSLIPSVVVGSQLISLVRFLEITLWLLFAFWIGENVRWEERGKIFLLLGLGVVWVSLLALGQFLLQRQFFGYWFLGEPSLLGAAGLARTSFFGKEIIRAYGTFPHPNMLGGILSVILVWLVSARFWGAAFAGLGALIVSFSRLAALSFLGGLLGLAAMTLPISINNQQIAGLGYAELSYQQSTINNLLDDPSFSRRLELLQAAGKMFQLAPLTGVGLGQFTARLPEFGVPAGLILFLQPVHNIFALIAAESGIFALVAFLLLLVFAFRETVRMRRWLLLVSLLQLVFLGSFDHYLYTLPQGLFLLSLILGFAFSQEEKDRA